MFWRSCAYLSTWTLSLSVLNNLSFSVVTSTMFIRLELLLSRAEIKTCLTLIDNHKLVQDNIWAKALETLQKITTRIQDFCRSCQKSWKWSLQPWYLKSVVWYSPLLGKDCKNTQYVLLVDPNFPIIANLRSKIW